MESQTRPVERTAHIPCQGRILILALMVWTFGSCGAHSLVREPDTEYGRLRGCAPEEFEGELPPVDRLLMVSTLTPALRGVVAEYDLRNGRTAELTMWYGPEGTNTRRDVVLSSLSSVVADSVQELVFAALKKAPEQKKPWGLRLKIGFGKEIAYSLHPREYCPPRPRDPGLLEAVERNGLSGTRFRGGVRERTVWLRVTVHPVGYVVDAQVEKGVSSGGALEQRLADFIKQYSFDPARLDGIPVVGQILVPIRIRA